MIPNKTQLIHLIGIAGTGMGAFAGLLKQAGFKVQGSDANTYPPMKDKLKDWGIRVLTPYAEENLENPRPDYVVVGNAVSKNHPEVQALLEKEIPYTSFPQALHDLFLIHHQPMVVCGTHGKTTTSALLAHTLSAAGRDPGFLIGGILQNFQESFRVPNIQNAPFVVEGDEYDTAFFDKGPKFLHYAPQYLLCTSLEYDHADIYSTVEQIEQRFTELFNLLTPKGHALVCMDFPNLSKALLKAKPKGTIQTYSINKPEADYHAQNIDEGPEGIGFDVYFKGENLGRVQLGLSGMYNVANALGAYGLLKTFGLTHEAIQKGFLSFRSVKRRMEVVGEVNEVVVIDDFAHHPTAVKSTILGAQHKYPDYAIWALFEPKSASSCRKVFQHDFAYSFEGAKKVFLAPAGRSLDPEIALDIPLLVQEINKQVPSKAQYFNDIDQMAFDVAKKIKPKTVVLCMSNGSFGGIHQKILGALELI